MRNLVVMLGTPSQEDSPELHGFDQACDAIWMNDGDHAAFSQKGYCVITALVELHRALEQFRPVCVIIAAGRATPDLVAAVEKAGIPLRQVAGTGPKRR